MKKILVATPHPDDEVMGVGGTIIKNATAGCDVYICIVCCGKEPLFRESDIKKCRVEATKCHRSLGVRKCTYLDFPSVMLETVPRHELNGKILEVMQQIKPDELYIPHIGDMQKDHKIVAEACMVAARPKYNFAPKKILAYETLSETGWNIPNVQNEFIPNVYVDITEQLDAKTEAMRCYGSQLEEFPNARSIEAIEALAKYRGAMMNVNAAEAFMLIREIL